MSKKLLSVILAGVMLLAMPGMAVLADTEAGELYDPEHGVRVSTTDPRVTEEAYLDVSVTEEGEELEACAKDLDKDLGIYLYTIQVKTRNQEEPLDLAGAEYAKCRISFPFGTMPGRTCRVYRVTKDGTLEPLKSSVDTYMIDGHTFLFDYNRR